MSLTANRPLSEVRRLKWKTEDGDKDGGAFTPARGGTPDSVTLAPMQVRTFLVTFSQAQPEVRDPHEGQGRLRGSV